VAMTALAVIAAQHHCNLGDNAARMRGSGLCDATLQEPRTAADCYLLSSQSRYLVSEERAN
jgi:hypothetical protein